MMVNFSLAQNSPCLIHFEPMEVPSPGNNNAKYFEIHVTITKADDSKVSLKFDYDGINESINYYFNDLPKKNLF